MDGAESVRSMRSDRSHRSSGRYHTPRNGGDLTGIDNNGGVSGERHRHRNRHQHGSEDGERRSHHHHRHRSSSGHRRHHHHSLNADNNGSVRGADSVRDDRSVTIKIPSDSEMGRGDGDYGDGRMEAKILPQDDDWGETGTAITDNTSETGFSVADSSYMNASARRGERGLEESVGFQCSAHVGTACAFLLAAASFLSPVAMVVLPLVGVFPGWVVDTTGTGQAVCGVACQGSLIGFAIKLLILAAGSWALFIRRQKASLPRVFVLKALALFILCVTTFAFWLFYAFLGSRGADAATAATTPNPLAPAQPNRDAADILAATEAVRFIDIVQFAGSMVDTLLFVHYLAVVLIELIHLRPSYCVTVVRSPDGASRTFPLGQLSIQRAAVSVLEKYYCEFTSYNRYLDTAISRKLTRAAALSSGAGGNGSSTQFKVYDVDGPVGGGDGTESVRSGGASSVAASRAVFAAHARRRDTGHNGRFYEEAQLEQKLARRKARLVTAAEEAFTHVKRLDEDEGPGVAIPLDPRAAAGAIFPSMGRSLQKYLRVTKQQPLYTNEAIIDHLSVCLSHDASPRAFVEEYLDQGRVIGSCSGRAGGVVPTRSANKGDESSRDPEGGSGEHGWSLVCDAFLSSSVRHGSLFRLTRGDVSLLCTVRRLPFFNLNEEVVDPKVNRFVLKMNSETSV